MSSKIFKLSDSVTIQSLGVALVQFFLEKKGMIAEGREIPQGYIIQAKNRESWKKMVGMDNAIQVQIIDMNNGSVDVQLGEAKWSDKLMTAGVGLYFPPLLLSSAFGAWQQKQLPDEIFHFVENYIMSGWTPTATPNFATEVATENQVACPSCNTRNSVHSKFCMNCGAGLFDTCPNCNTQLAIGTKFCSECGANVQQAKQKHCAGCGHEVDTNAKFCNNCGMAQ